MPGTHYDNDYSFIEDLPYEFRRVAALIIRDTSFYDLLKAVKQGKHPAFDHLSRFDHLNDLTRQTLNAVLVAKITFFAKDCFIREEEFLFIEKQLYDALSRLLDCQEFNREFLLKKLSLGHYKTYEWLTRPRDESKRYSLEVRKRLENLRRYFRYRAALKHHFVRLGNHEIEQVSKRDIYSSGIMHFSKMVNQKLDNLADQYQVQITSVLGDMHPVAHQLFATFFEQYEDLRAILNGVSIGLLEIDQVTQRLTANLNRQYDYSALKQNHRTEQMLVDFRAKLDQISHHTLELLKNSTPHALFQGPQLEKLKVDDDIYHYIESSKKNKSPLMGAFVSLYYYSHLLEKIYNNIASSEFILMFPQYWVNQYHNLSASGFAFYSEFLVHENDILQIMLRINKSSDPNEEDYEILQQKAKVVRIEEHPEKEMYLIACQFLLSEEHNLKLINYAVQAYEIHEAYAAFNNDSD